MLCVVEHRLCHFSVRHSVIVNMIVIGTCHHQHYFINVNMILSCYFMATFFDHIRCDPKVLRRVVSKDYCALHLAANTVTT